VSAQELAVGNAAWVNRICVRRGWYGKRFYHATGMISNWYGMRESLAIVTEEGLVPSSPPPPEPPG